jgi:uncharacterized membrane protein
VPDHVPHERVTAFTDAAVAIALTLLVLPLLDSARDAANTRTPLHTIVHTYGDSFLAFAVSFLVIARFWRVHRRLYQALSHLDEGLVVINLAWLFGIVFLPVPTALLVVSKDSMYGGAGLYAINLLFIGLVSFAMTVWILRHPGLWEPGVDRDWLRESTWRGAAACVLMAAAVPIAFWLGSWGLLVLLVLPASQRASTLLGHLRVTAKDRT